MAIIEVDNLTKEYQLGQLIKFKDTLGNLLNHLRGKKLVRREKFRALDSVSFTIEEGEVVGIIGTNGAGKSTLLKLISGITTPTNGKIHVGGSIAPLIEVGAGFVSDLTGRENIYLNGAIMGISRDMLEEKIDEIIEFAELEQFIDTPIKRYSSGMSVRLGFAVATSIDADILIVDEVLAVGDLAFQRKCFDRMEGLIKRRGKTVLLVSHNIRQVERICARVLLLDHGQIVDDGNPSEICNLFYERSNKQIQMQHAQVANADNGKAINTGEIDVKDITTYHGASKTPTDEIPMHEVIRIGISFDSFVNVPKAEIIIGFHTTDFIYLASTSSAVIANHPNLSEGRHYIECKLDDLPLMPGVYCIRLAFIDQARRMMWYGESLKLFTVTAGKSDITKMPEIGLVDLPFNWEFRKFD